MQQFHDRDTALRPGPAEGPGVEVPGLVHNLDVAHPGVLGELLRHGVVVHHGARHAGPAAGVQLSSPVERVIG